MSYVLRSASQPESESVALRRAQDASFIRARAFTAPQLAPKASVPSWGLTKKVKIAVRILKTRYPWLILRLHKQWIQVCSVFAPLKVSHNICFANFRIRVAVPMIEYQIYELLCASLDYKITNPS